MATTRAARTPPRARAAALLLEASPRAVCSTRISTEVALALGLPASSVTAPEGRRGPTEEGV
eukprot:747456-Prorocentrum_minimum.AAC.1